jgi:DNA-binding MarR family transcriptional regulator
MGCKPKPESAAPDLAIGGPERLLLFCVANDMDWQRAGVTGETVTAMVVQGLIERDSANRLTLTDAGRAALRAMQQRFELGPYQQTLAISKEIETQTDRGAAIIAAQVINEHLKALILARFKKLSRKEEKQLFETPNAPLSSFFARIEIAYALAVIADEDRSALHLIRDVRNAFAHRIEPLTFEHHDIAEMVRTRMDDKIKNTLSKASPRMLFIYRCTILMTHLGLAALGDIRIKQFEVSEQQYFKDFWSVLKALIVGPLIEAGPALSRLAAVAPSSTPDTVPVQSSPKKPS